MSSLANASLTLFIIAVCSVSSLAASKKNNYELNSVCANELTVHSASYLKKIEDYSAELKKDLERGSYANTNFGVVTAFNLFTANPFGRLKKLEFGIKRLLDQRALSRAQYEMLSRLCIHKQLGANVIFYE